MSAFSNTPHLLTKEKLKSALKANDIALPRTEQRKAFYVDLYREHLTSQNDAEEEFSSDEEESSDYSPMRASEKLPAKPQKIVINKKVKGGLPFDVTALSDGDLARQMRSFGAPVGPITTTTRPLYQNKLAKLLAEEMKNPVIPTPTKISPKQKKVLTPPPVSTPPTPPEAKKKEYSDFSDSNDDATAELEMEVDAVERLSYDLDQQDQQDARPQELPLPTLSSTPSKSTPRKRVITSTVTTRQHTRQAYSTDTGNSVQKTDSVEIVAVKKMSTPPVKEEQSIFGPHIQILLAVLVFVVFTVFLIYHMMEDAPSEGITDETNSKL
ncbi:hypothetical protein OS493_033305 [Desmophyllum pertusum]|uniref:Lamina-associated polypeptide 2 n=1 Tax=Desmophyllum pertusum TaxID=174260 RepID=A0A9W9Z7J4_9CNID|nr:hypothetical protein OS493_033305 [Desmophyllum pertusum]